MPRITSLQKESFRTFLLDGKSITDSSAAAGFDRTTGTRLLREPEFLASLKEQTEPLIYQSYSRLVSISDKAITALVEVLDEKFPPKSSTHRIRAASVVLDQLARLGEFVETERRLKTLELEAERAERDEQI